MVCIGQPSNLKAGVIQFYKGYSALLSLLYSSVNLRFLMADVQIKLVVDVLQQKVQRILL